VTNNEALWIEQALQGSEEAFGFLVEAYKNQVFSLCFRMLGNSFDAEDAAQESFIRAFLNLKKYDKERSFATWLLSIASHYCIDSLRKRRIIVTPIESLPAEIIPDNNAPNPERSLRSQEKERFVAKLLNQLKPTDRAAIVLRYWHECSEAEIAEVLNLSISSVKSRLFRARRELANLWVAEQGFSKSPERRANESSTI
jgi:RNA polymerase sigma-70 factor (ECF subfamily)